NVEVTFRSGGSQAEAWDAMKGQVFAANVQNQTADSTTISLDFEAYQSHVVIFSKRKSDLPRWPKPGAVVSMIDLSADWQAAFGQNSPVAVKRLHSWTDDEPTRFFSGTATYERFFDLPGNSLGNGNTVYLDFGEGQALDVLGS